MPPSDTRRKRCAVYTRKSSEEGLEQEFNSLHAQREACEAYIRSQRHEGWSLVTTAYDDGGISGGTMERPALQRLLADIRSGRIDVVVTYKVDRLTRSLADFARLIETFDKHVVSFISVTQQFNTTTSMGRLTLNVLLSFAQFEREVTGERIRDKIAASKQKGMWMGGNPPLGYDPRDRKLVLNPQEADTVRRLFALYLELGCVRQVKDAADRLGLITKTRIARGVPQGGKPFSRGHLYKLLSNPIYLGRIAHKGQLYEGRHEPLIDQATWDAVQERLNGNGQHRRNGAEAREPSLLTGLLFDTGGERLSPSHAVKKGKRYRYYISRSLITEAGSDHGRGWRLPAHDIEQAVIGAVARALKDRAFLIEQIGSPGASPDQIRNLLDSAEQIAAVLDMGSAPERARTLRELVARIVIEDDMLAITLRRAALRESSAGDDEDPIRFSVPVQFRRRGVEMKLVIAGDTARPARPDPVLIKAVARAHLWFEDLATGRVPSLQAIADREGITESYVRRLIPLAFLAPGIVKAILEGEQPVELSAARLTGAVKLPLDWNEQQRLLCN
jgi:site-specific DNA recombinase